VDPEVGLRTDFPNTEARIQYLENGVKMYALYIEYLLEAFDLWSEDGTFTFPTGDTFYRRKLKVD